MTSTRASKIPSTVHYKRAAFEAPDETPAAFALELMVKDLDLILALAEEAGVPMEQARVNRALGDRAVGWASARRT